MIAECLLEGKLLTQPLRLPDTGDIRRDDIAIFEVMTETVDQDWWRAYREVLEKRFAQEEIVVRAVHIKRL